MVTSKNPYIRTVGKNLFTHFVINLNSQNKKFLDIVFERNEREALGKRILIAIYILEDYSFIQIVERLNCGKNTVAKVSDNLDKYSGDKLELLKYLRTVYFSQFPKKYTRSYSPRSLIGSKRMFGLDKDIPIEECKVKMI